MTPEKLLSYGLPLFEGLTPADFGDITLAASEVKRDAWQTIFDQDDNSNDLYFLLSGALLAVFWTTQGREIVFSRFPIGSYFGELTAFDGAARSLAVVAKSESTVLVLKRQSFLDLFAHIPQVRDRITLGLVASIRNLTERNMEMTTLSVDQRVAAFLLRLAAQEGKLTGGGVIENAPTHAEIAGTIGANREMVSRAISKLSKQGVIKSSRQKIVILDPDALSQDD